MKLVILDRDGTINHDSDDFIKSPEEWKPIKGSLEGIARLTQAGYRIAVATNQSGIARGKLDTRTLFAIHDTLNRALAQVGGRIDAFFDSVMVMAKEDDLRHNRLALLRDLRDAMNRVADISKLAQ